MHRSTNIEVSKLKLTDHDCLSSNCLSSNSLSTDMIAYLYK